MLLLSHPKYSSASWQLIFTLVYPTHSLTKTRLFHIFDQSILGC